MRRNVKKNEVRQNRRVIEENRKTVTIPYIKGASEAIRRVLAPLGIRTALRSANMKWSVMGKIMDGAEKGEIPGVVYAVGCKSAGRSTLGEEKERRTRMGRVERSAIAEHVHATGQRVHCMGSEGYRKGTARQKKKS